MNTLHRTLAVNEVVVLKKRLFKPEYQEQKSRLFKVFGGFGMHAETAGRAIYGKFLEDGEECRFNGDDIDPEETKAYQAEHGAFGDTVSSEA